MSEVSRESGEIKSLKEVLGDGQWHLVLSALRISPRSLTSFWVSEIPEEPLGERADHQEAQGYLVDFLPETWAREGSKIATSGRSSMIDELHTLQLIILEQGAHIRRKLPKTKQTSE